MATNQFYQFDTGQQNMLDTYDYSHSATRTVGVGRGLASSMLHNKIFFQVSTITSALAEAMKNKGYDMLDPDATNCWSTIVAQFANIMTQADMGSYATQSWVQTYVDGLLRPLATGYVKYSEMVTYVAANMPTGGDGGITIANVRDAINATFNTSGSSTTIPAGGISFASKRATNTEIQNGSGGNYICPESLKASAWIPLLNPSGEGYLIYSEGGYWVRKAWATLASQFVSADTQSLTNYYTKTYIDANYYKKTEVYTKQEASDNFQTAAEVNTQISSFGFLTPSSISSTKQTPGCVKIPSGTTGGILICWGTLTISKSQSGSTYAAAPLQTAPNFAASFNGAPFTVIIGNAILEHADNAGYTGIHVVGQYSNYFTYKVCARGTSTEMPNQTVQYVAFGQY